MPRLIGMNHLESIDANVPPIGEYFIGREQPDTKTLDGRALLELAPLYSGIRDTKSLADTRLILLSVWPEAFGDSISFRGLCELAKKHDVNIALLHAAVPIARRLGRGRYKDVIFPTEYRMSGGGLAYISPNGSIHNYSGGLMFPYAGDFMRISHRHAELTPVPDGLRIRDLGSKYGTAVDGMIIGINRKIEEVGQDERRRIPSEELRGEAEAPYGSVISLSPLVFGLEYSFALRRNGTDVL